MSAKQIFDQIVMLSQRGTRDVVEQAPVFKELLRKGRTRKEIHTAIDLLSCITLFDVCIFFTEAELIQTELIYDKNPNKWLAHYSCEEDSYAVYVKDLDTYIDNTSGLILFENGNGIDVDPESDFLREETLLFVAAHEVRHKIQNRNDISLFSKQNIGDGKYATLLYDYAVYCEDYVFPNRRKKLSQEGEGPDYIQERIGADELDATIVALLATSRVRQGANLAEVINIIQLTPNGSGF